MKRLLYGYPWEPIPVGNRWKFEYKFRNIDSSARLDNRYRYLDTPVWTYQCHISIKILVGNFLYIQISFRAS